MKLNGENGSMLNDKITLINLHQLDLEANNLFLQNIF